MIRTTRRWAARRLLACVAAAILMLTSGCSGPRLYPVKGVVCFEDGQPARELVEGMVIFTSDELHVRAYGVIMHDATFRLTSQIPGDGAMPGLYRVTVFPPGLGEKHKKGPKRPTPPLLDPRFQKSATSGMEFRVEPKENAFTISVRRYQAKNQAKK